MTDVIGTLNTASLENTGQQRSSGKRSRNCLHQNDGSAVKRRALACLSNHVDSLADRQQLKNTATTQSGRTASSVFDLPPPTTITSLSSSFHFESPGDVASPMLLSTPSLTCSETISQPDNDSQSYPQDYTTEIFTYLREAEVRWQPQIGYMQKQTDITLGMRSVLVDWLVEVGDEFSLQTSTLYQAVGLVDRFLSLMSVLRGKLQLVGATAMYVAAKLEEIYPPELADFAYITDNTYSQKQIVQMEKLMLQSLDYHLIAPSSTSFLHHYLDIGTQQSHSSANLQTSVQHLAQYLCEMALVHSDPFLKYLPSEVAAASVCLSRHTLDQQPAWSDSFQQCTGYSVSDFGHCLQDMHRMFAMASQQPQQAVRLKYCSERFSRVALLAIPETLPM
ncbi:Cyclin-A2 [Geodia barretti]|uniref:Cyclin-A2 n=1 Tax=Geodia barretti TaxID=519541 RepID=A0AA35XED3_GEOBA|nr:Cyclin-A2 [Geodia barretti]